MSIQLHFLREHLDYFRKNSRYFWEEPGERFPLDIFIMDDRYQGQWDVNFPANYWWCLKRDEVASKHKRKSLKIPFIHDQLLLRIFQFNIAQYELFANISALNLTLFVLFKKKINSVNTILYIPSKSLYLKKLI